MTDRKNTRSKRGPGCDSELVAAFDYSALDAAFSKLGKPAKRALLNNKIHSPKDLSRWTLAAVAKLHGIGPSSLPLLKLALRKSGYAFAA